MLLTAEFARTALGDNIKKRRKELGLRQKDLAERSGLSVAAIRLIEAGRTREPQPQNLRKIAEALEVSIPVLTGEVDVALDRASVLLDELAVSLGQSAEEIRQRLQAPSDD